MISKKNLLVFKKIHIIIAWLTILEDCTIIQNFNREDTRASNVNKDEPRINEKINALQIRLIDENGINVGLMNSREALRRANEAGLDLVEISSTPSGSVCKIMDAGKYKYELQKRKNEARKKQKVQETKEIKFTPNIGDNDYQVKMRNAKKFLAEGNKVKFTLRFRGREMSYQDLGEAVLKRAAEDVADVAKIEQSPKLDGRNMGMLVAPK